MSAQKNGALRLTSVTKTFAGVTALSDVSILVRTGEVHGLVGQNGAGKSTLMSIASGALLADSGTVTINGVECLGNPEMARELGLAIVRQEPALMPDLTVAENIYLGVASSRRPPMAILQAWTAERLRQWSETAGIHPADRVETLEPGSRFIVEIVKALANEPKVLILDEPTEHLASDDVARLFDKIRACVQAGTSVVYISHRIKEVKQISDRISVLRDGRSCGTFEAASLSEDAIVELIVGEMLRREFPPKVSHAGAEVFAAQSLSGHGFHDVTLSVAAGEIFGIAGISDNGQREFLRAVAGLERFRGEVRLEGEACRYRSSTGAVVAGIAFLPGDRHREGIIANISVRENFSIRSIGQYRRAGMVSSAEERRLAEDAVNAFAVKTAGIEVPIRSLSGGNQQKVVLASVLQMRPKLLLVEEPTQGVDIGARSEIYQRIRAASASGMAVIVVSTDATELAGLCDRVGVFSRGRMIDCLEGAAVSEPAILGAMLTSTSTREQEVGMSQRLTAIFAGNLGPAIVIAFAILSLGVVAHFMNPHYLTSRNFSAMMVLSASLALVAYAQQLVMLVGEIDLSVGPMMGLAVVAASFWLGEGTSGALVLLALLGILALSVGVGLLNWSLVDRLRLHPMVATLSTFMGLQAVSLWLRPTPDGIISSDLMDLLAIRIGPIPAGFIGAVLIGLVLEIMLFRTRTGFSLRGLGSRPETAKSIGISPSKIRLIAFVGASALAFLAAVTLIPQVGVGDPRTGINFTLASVAAAVIGGASLFGGKGSFVGAFLGAIFITQVNTVTTFLRLDPAWQSYLLGGLIIMAVASFLKLKRMAVA